MTVRVANSTLGATFEQPLRPPVAMLRSLLAASATIALLSACASEPAEPSTAGVVVDTTAATGQSNDEYAVATVAPLGDGDVAGTVEFIGLEDAVEIRYNLTGLQAGPPHGFHVHENGDCGADSTGTPGSAAGGHFNPLVSPHGAPDAAKTARHAGDLGNVRPDAQGHAVGVVVDSVLAFSGPTSMLGKALVVHAGTDDLASQPSGDAGARVGCGVIGPRPDALPAP